MSTPFLLQVNRCIPARFCCFDYCTVLLSGTAFLCQTLYVYFFLSQSNFDWNIIDPDVVMSEVSHFLIKVFPILAIKNGHVCVSQIWLYSVNNLPAASNRLEKAKKKKKTSMWSHLNVCFVYMASTLSSRFSNALFFLICHNFTNYIHCPKPKNLKSVSIFLINNYQVNNPASSSFLSQDNQVNSPPSTIIIIPIVHSEIFFSGRWT